MTDFFLFIFCVFPAIVTLVFVPNRLSTLLMQCNEGTQNGTSQDQEISEGNEGKSYGSCWVSCVRKQADQVLGSTL